MDAIITHAKLPGDFLEARGLLEEYARDIGLDLSFQNFGAELDDLARMYAPPRGCLLLARLGEEIVGCVAVRPFRDDVCEMKRLYVRPSGRERGIGRRLAAAVVDEARGLGYGRMVLDTLRAMTTARELYRSLGFREIPAYYENPIEDTVYMELALD